MLPFLFRIGGVDDFHQLHFRHGVEKMNAGQPPGLLQHAADGFQGDAGGVGGEHGGIFQHRFDAFEQVLLGVYVFDDGFDHHVRRGNAQAFEVRDQTVHGRLHPARRLQAFAEQLMGAFDGGRDEFRFPVLQGDRQSLQHAPGGDVAAHGAGADDVHPLEPRLLTPAQRFQPVLQLEGPHQVAGGFRRHQSGDGARLGVQHVTLVAAVTLPGVDESEGRRVLIGPGFLTRCITQVTGEEFS